MSESFALLPLSSVQESPLNPRRHYDEDKLAELASSIKEHGIIQPLLARPRNGHYEIAAGHRRRRAAETAGLVEVPVIIREMDDQQFLEVLTIENLQREDVHPLDEAHGYVRLLERPGYDVKIVAAKVGKSETYIYQRLRLTHLIEPAQKLLWDETITAAHALLIARLPAHQQVELLDKQDGVGLIGWKGEVLSVAELRDEIARTFFLDLHKAPFPKAACAVCPKRTGFTPALFPDVKKGDTCTDSKCFDHKLDQHCNEQLAKFQGKGDFLKLSGEYGQLKPQEKAAGLMERGAWEECKKKDEGAKQGLVLTGHNRGQVLWVRERKRVGYDGGSDDYRAKARAQEKAAKRERAIRAEIVRQVVIKFVNDIGELDEYTWDLVLKSMAQRAGSDICKIVNKRRGWEIPKGEYGECAAIVANLKDLVEPELCGLALELALSGDVPVNSWGEKLKEDRKHLAEIAKLYDVDVKAIEKGIPETKAAKAGTKKAKGGTKPQTKEKKRKPAETHEAKCRICGCTEDNPCEGGCYWVKDPQMGDLCSNCGESAEEVE